VQDDLREQRVEELRAVGDVGVARRDLADGGLEEPVGDALDGVLG
jgi:hypothetical protein